ncbi:MULTISPECIES: hypothetical protein [unclassified Rhodococcus (in: high G+C Gram-positive bacteria)]|uniref:hypothetical protein n=1 Tax=unclassified Rhodococcus (in: high G+C Gram-positive bacteria) TaxID=192944 RepID=UPI0011EE5847|nr:MULTISPECIES: hypothetical protein [unclassified Rhodococcus (in: high G+C Gram-positive bacteria)]KAA0927632.1 hypothetical protein FQ188_00560 [Rhodococcus sp. ANT_H53B]MDI9927956.1 hypothetical protein [Rhodococcus sp. IEGM 1341]
MTSNDKVAALSALYEAERSDLATISGNALHLSNLSLAYMAGAAAVWATRGDDIPWEIAPWLPIPVWAFLGFHVLIIAKVWVHNISIEALEIELIEEADLPGGNRKAVGRNASRTVVDLPDLWNRERWPFAAATLLSYGGGAVIAISFAVISISQAWLNGAWPYAVLSTSINLVCMLTITIAWIYVFKIKKARIVTWNYHTR